MRIGISISLDKAVRQRLEAIAADRNMPATMTHDDKRNGTIPLFAALNVLNGTLTGQNMQRHRHQELLRFLKRHLRCTFHFTPTSCSWLNAVEGFFAKPTQWRLKHDVFRSVVDLQAAINRFVVEHNQTPKPFVWRPTPTPSSPHKTEDSKC